MVSANKINSPGTFVTLDTVVTIDPVTTTTSNNTTVVPPTQNTGFWGNLWNNASNILTNSLNNVVSSTLTGITNATASAVAEQPSLQETLSNLGTNVLDNTLKGWFSRNWLFIVLFPIGLFVLFKLFFGKKTVRRSTFKRRY